MGLDVTLYHCTDFPAAIAADEAFDNATDALYADDKLSDEDRQKQIDVLKAQYGIKDYRPEVIVKVDEPSKLYPEHMFGLGYYRSSYNSGGINSVLRRMGVPDLYAIFNVEDDRKEYYLSINWDLALHAVNSALEQFDRAAASDRGKYQAMEVYGFDIANSETEAMDIFLKQLEGRTPGSMRSYGCRAGNFFLDGIKVFGFISAKSLLGTPSTYAIIEQTRADDSGEGDWYRQALEIVKESIEYVLAQPEPNDYRLGWSA